MNSLYILVLCIIIDNANMQLIILKVVNIIEKILNFKSD